MKRRGIFAIVTSLFIAASKAVRDALTLAPTYSTPAYRGEGRNAFLSISTPRCHTQRYKNGRRRI